MLLNTNSGEIESEFHMYVQPQEHTKLSDFCKELTGITQVCSEKHHFNADRGILIFLNVSLRKCCQLFNLWKN